jgi:hypothetical protein
MLSQKELKELSYTIRTYLANAKQIDLLLISEPVNEQQIFSLQRNFSVQGMEKS